jgi:hypothetical protein
MRVVNIFELLNVKGGLLFASEPRGNEPNSHRGRVDLVRAGLLLL